MTVNDGPTIPGLRFVRPLGAGGFAEVHLYQQASSGQEVVVKVVRADLTPPATPRELATFTAAADAMARLGEHPSIVSVVSVGTTSAAQGARPYLVMQYCPPPDLGSRVLTEPLSVPEAVRTGIKLAGGLETAHRSGIIHRDIKPSQVLVTPHAEPALTDFGISGGRPEPETGHAHRASHPWSPPELLDGRSDGSVASDVYSLGATIWTLMVGRSPFSIADGDDSPRALSARILHSAPPSIPRSDVPPALEHLLTLCLAKTPADRPGSALELARSLQQVETRSGFTTTSIAVDDERPDQTDGAPTVAVAPAHTAAELPDRPHRPDRPARPAESHARLSATAWWTVAAVVLVVLVGALAWRAASAGDRSAAPGTTAPTAHGTGAPGVTPRPLVTAHRAGHHVAYRWRPSDTPQPGESYEWRVPGHGSHLTNGTATTVTAATRVCLRVRLLRAGLPPSAWASACA